MFRKEVPKPLKELLVVFTLVIFIFVIQANIAWINPSPGFSPRLKLSSSVPLLWQYFPDALFELSTAVQFPEIFHHADARVSRPVYPAMARGIGFLLQVTYSPFTRIDPILATIFGHLFLKIAMYTIFGFLLFRLSRKFMDEKPAFLPVMLILFHSHAITHVASYGTVDLQFISPLIICCLFFNISSKYNTTKNILYSLIIGVLMLAKENYALYLAVVLFSLYKKQYKKISLSVLIHLIPLGIWLVFLKMYGLKYSHHGAEVYDQGVWLWREFIFMSPVEMLKTVQHSIALYIKCLAEFHVFWLFIAFYSLNDMRKELGNNVILFISIFVFTNWLQIFTAKRYLAYMTSDLSFIIFGLASCCVGKIIHNRFKNHENAVVVGIGCMWLIWNLLSMTHFPWIHPYNH